MMNNIHSKQSERKSTILMTDTDDMRLMFNSQETIEEKQLLP